jgi:hypothetical protein
MKVLQLFSLLDKEVEEKEEEKDYAGIEYCFSGN